MVDTDDQRKRPPPLRPAMTPLRLRQLAENYVSRFGGPSSNLRRVLNRHVAKAAGATVPDSDLDPNYDRELNFGVTAQWKQEISAIVEDFIQAGALDDGRYAQQAAQTLAQRGVALRAVAMRLRQKGLAQADIAQAVAQLGEPRQVEWQAALQLVRRRRLGPYRPQEQRKQMRHKDAAALCRAGFSASIAFAVVDGQQDPT